jgi:hypothetical protein
MTACSSYSPVYCELGNSRHGRRYLIPAELRRELRPQESDVIGIWEPFRER